MINLDKLTENGLANADFVMSTGGETFQSNNANKSHYLIYSLTKTFLAVVILKLVEQGKLNLNDNLSRWHPDIINSDKIIIKQLLNHTSGLPDYGGLPTYHEAVKEHPLNPWSFEAFLTNTLIQGAKGAPGEKFYYSNIGYALVKNIIELTTELSLPDALQNLLFDPYELGQSSVPTKGEDLYNLVKSEHCGVDVRYNYHPGWVAHGVIASTANDVAVFFDKLFSGKIISGKSLDVMRELIDVPFNHKFFSNPSYGLGLMSGVIGQGRLYGHTGEGPGYSAISYFIEDKSKTLVTILNAGENPGTLEQTMVEML